MQKTEGERCEETRRGFETRAELRQRREAVTGLCGDSRPVKPINVEVMPPASCSKTAIMKNTGEDNIKWLLHILQWRLVSSEVRVAEAQEAEAGFSAAD